MTRMAAARARARRTISGGAVIILAVSGRASTAAAQADPRLVAAVRQAQEGRGDSARSAVRQLLGATAPRDPLYPELLYTTALTAGDATERERALQRVVVEYPVSPWTDHALLLLAQSTYANGNLPGVTRHLERLRTDFPASPVLARAAVWAARTYFDTRNQPAACRWIALGLARQPDRDVREQLTFQAQRCGTLPEVPPAPASIVAASAGRTAPAGDTALRRVPVDTVQSAPGQPVPVPPTQAQGEPAQGELAQPAPVQPAPVQPAAAGATPRTAPSSTPAAGAFRVQIAAAGTQAEADGIARALRAKGIDADVTADKGYFKVRSGRFPTSAEAQREAARLRSRLGGAPFVVRP